MRPKSNKPGDWINYLEGYFELRNDGDKSYIEVSRQVCDKLEQIGLEKLTRKEQKKLDHLLQRIENAKESDLEDEREAENH